MKPKIIVAIILVAVAAGGVWLLLRRAAPPSPTAAAPNGVPPVESQPDKNFPHPVPAISQALPATPGMEAAVLSPVKKIVDSHVNYAERVGAMQTLSTNLPENDSPALQDFLLRADPADGEQSGQVLKNQLLDVLCALNPPPSWLSGALIQMYHDRNQDVVIRDYAIQHLAALYQQMDLLRIADPPARQNIQNTLWEALQETDSSIAGTALLALDRLSTGDSTTFDRQHLGTAALQLANNGGAGELSRITAFQICARLEVKDALPAIWQAAQEGGNLPVQISAIRALGSLGGSNAKLFLEKILNGTEPRLKPAAQSALNEIKKHEQKI